MKVSLKWIIILLWIFCISTEVAFTQHISKDNHTGNWETSTTWNPAWTTPQTSVSGYSITIYGYITANNALTFSGATGTLVINDTLVINGNLTINNTYGILINGNGILIVRGNLIMSDQATIQTNGYVIVTGDFIKNGSASQGSFSSNNNPYKVFIGGAISSALTNNNLNFPALNCTNPSTTTYTNSTCSYGNMTDIIDDPIYPFFQATCTTLPTASIAISETSGTTNNDGNICTGASATLTASGGTSYVWSSGETSAAITKSPTSTTPYSVTVTNTYGCKAGKSQSITVNSLPTASIAVTETSGTTNNDKIICAGASATLTASGGTAYVWSSGETFAAITKSPASTTSYSVTVTNANGCTANTSQTITVNTLPTPAVAVSETSGTTNNDGNICTGASATLTASGGTAYVWSSGETSAAITKSPASTTSYSVTVTNANGCTANASQTITVNTLPTPAVAVSETSGTTNNDGNICTGASATLTASGGTAYVWSSGEIFAAITKSPNSTTAYSVTVTNANGCTANTSQTITVNSLPTPAVAVSETSGTTNNDGNICTGASAGLTTSGGTAYVWSSGETSAAITKSPASTTAYSVTVTNANGCTANASQIITVNTLPAPGIAIAETSGTTNNDGNICTGASAGLTASGGTAYVWSSGETFAAITKSPNSTTAYSVTVTNANGCTANTSQTITVNTLPTPAIAISETSGTTNNDGNICTGASAGLTASGGTAYVWSSGETSAAITKSPASTTAYSVTVTNANGCTANTSQIITVNTLPAPGIAVSETSGTTNNDGNICTGASATLTASGGTAYVWSSGETFAAITKSPASTTSYSVTVANANGCTANASQTITVNTLPTPAIAIAETSGTTNNDGNICIGASATLTASGGTAYVWSSGETFATITKSPNSTTAYSVTVTNANGCTANTSQTITVNSLPIASIAVTETSGSVVNDGNICYGASVSLSASGGSSYLWNTGQTSAQLSVSPVTETTYSVTVTSNGCTAVNSQNIVVYELPLVSVNLSETSGITSNDGIICSGASVTLNASGGGSYLWNTGEITASNTKSPAITTTYSVTITNMNGCKGTASQSITVNPLPNASIVVSENSGTNNNDGTICAGTPVTLTISDEGTYIWSTGETTSNIIQSPAANTSYAVTVTDVYGCSNSNTKNILVDVLPNGIAASNSPICEESDIFLSSANGASYSWSGPNGFTSKNQNPTLSNANMSMAGAYFVTITSSNGCYVVNTTYITVNELPVAIAGPDQTLLLKSEIQMKAELSSAETGEWSIISGSGNIIDINSPTTRIMELGSGENIFSWTVHNAHCKTSANVSIIVDNAFVPSAITPNGDGKNDYFMVDIEKGRVELIIINKWGIVEYTNDNYLNEWDGRNNKGIALPNDTYFYILKLENGELKKGSVLIKK